VSGLTPISAPPVQHLSESGAFDYSSLPPSATEFLKTQVHRIRRQTAISIISIGKDLIAAKHYLSHGAFVSWVEAEVGIPARTAQAYMQVAHWSERKNATVALLPPSVLYLLSSPATPQAFVVDVLNRIESGERIGPPVIRSELKRLREQNAGGMDAVRSTAQYELRNGPTDSESTKTLSRAVTILACGLSAEGFAEVRRILTSKAVLEDPSLAQDLAAAFAAWATYGTNGWESQPRAAMNAGTPAKG
jgi:hypothetical protein